MINVLDGVKIAQFHSDMRPSVKFLWTLIFSSNNSTIMSKFTELRFLYFCLEVNREPISLTDIAVYSLSVYKVTAYRRNVTQSQL